MKEIKQLTPCFRTLEEDKFRYLRTFRKLKAMERWLKDNIPYNIIGKYYFSSGLGETCPRCFIYLNKNENSTIELMKWIASLKGKRLSVEKFWREENGYFTYRISRKYNSKYNLGTEYIFFFEEGANIDGCKIIQKRKMKKIFITDCEKDRIIYNEFNNE